MDKISTTGNHSTGSFGYSASTKPYLIRAIYQWALDNGLTPQILVNPSHEHVIVPAQYIQNNRIVLNIHPQSVDHLDLGNDNLVFSARFSGRAMELRVPVFSIMAIYARENSQGIVFQDEGMAPSPDIQDKSDSLVQYQGNPRDGRKNAGSSHLKLIKS